LINLKHLSSKSQKNMKKPINIILLLILIPLFGVSQTKEDLKKQKEAIEQEISYTSQLIKEIKQDKKTSVKYVNVLNQQIDNQEKLLNTVTTEIKITSRQIKKNQQEILNTESAIYNEEKLLQLLKDEYSKMIYALFAKKQEKNNLIFIVSSKDFNQAYKRLIYLKQYSSSRRNQANKIKNTQKDLVNKQQRLINQKSSLTTELLNKKNLIKKKKEELIIVNEIKKEKEEIIRELSKSEDKLREELIEKQDKAKNLNKKIRRIIEEEIRKSQKINHNNSLLSPEELKLSSLFSSNKGKLPWPLLKGVIVQKYGKQNHPVFKSIQTFNNGINIATDKNEIVRSVFDGKISRIFFIKGEGKAILINHGEYFSVYSGLKEVNVKTGDSVFAKEKIGVVLTKEKENITELHFEIWKGYEKENPSDWLYNAD